MHRGTDGEFTKAPVALRPRLPYAVVCSIERDTRGSQFASSAAWAFRIACSHHSEAFELTLYILVRVGTHTHSHGALEIHGLGPVSRRVLIPRAPSNRRNPNAKFTAYCLLLSSPKAKEEAKTDAADPHDEQVEVLSFASRLSFIEGVWMCLGLFRLAVW